MLLHQSGQSSVSSEYVRVLGRMLYDEPCVVSLLAILQNSCLKNGILLRWGHTPPTPSFQVATAAAC